MSEVDIPQHYVCDTGIGYPMSHTMHTLLTMVMFYDKRLADADLYDIYSRQKGEEEEVGITFNLNYKITVVV